MADLSLNVALVAASANATIFNQYNFGATVAQGDIVYKDANNRWQLKDANAAATGNEANSVTGIALVAGTNGQPAVVCVKDSYLTVGAALSNGVSYYASPNAGKIGAAADITSGNYPTFLGVARDTTHLNFNPTPAGIAV